MLDSISPISINKVPFKGSIQEQKSPEKQTEKQTEKQSDKSWMLWTGLAALGAVGVYFATRGKKGAETVEKGAENAAEQIKDIAVDAFKKAGNKFENGKAKLANGEAYTGNLTQKLKDGKTVVREYKNGMLEKVSKMDGEKVVVSKSYTYDDKGMLTRIVDNNKDVFNNDIFNASIDNGFKTIKTSKSTIVTDLNTGKLKRLKIDGKGDKCFYYDKEGKLKFVKHDYQDKDAINRHDFIGYYPDGKNIRFVKHGYNGAEFYDVNGNIVDKINIDLARGGISYKYDNLYRSSGFPSPGIKKTTYSLYDDGNNYERASLSIRKEKPDFYRSSMTITHNGEGYLISFDKKGQNIQIIDSQQKKLSPEADKKLFDEIVTDARNAYKEIISKHKKALRLRNELQLSDSEFCRMH